MGRMSPIVLFLLVASVEAFLTIPDGIQIGGGSGKCPPGEVEIACTNGFPRNCLCRPGSIGIPVPLPRPTPPGCSCSPGGRPVCGKNNRTFQNRCTADCLNEVVACDGSCPCPVPNPIPSPTPPGGILIFDLAKCQDAGDKAAFAAARAACSTVKSQCPVRPPQQLSASRAAGFASADLASVPAQVRRLIEKAIAEICRGIAESTCRNNAKSQVQDSDCSKLLSTGPAVSVPGCRSQQDANSIFTKKVNDLCQSDR